MNCWISWLRLSCFFSSSVFVVSHTVLLLIVMWNATATTHHSQSPQRVEKKLLQSLQNTKIQAGVFPWCSLVTLYIRATSNLYVYSTLDILNWGKKTPSSLLTPCGRRTELQPLRKWRTNEYEKKIEVYWEFWILLTLPQSQKDNNADKH